jgi:hypothetical protein
VQTLLFAREEFGLVIEITQLYTKVFLYCPFQSIQQYDLQKVKKQII